MDYKPYEQKIFNCANAIEPLRCLKCSNYETYKLVDLKQHVKSDHELLEFQEKLHECGTCSFSTHSRYLFLRHKLRNESAKSKMTVPEFELIGDEIADPVMVKFLEWNERDLETFLENCTHSEDLRSKTVKCQNYRYGAIDSHDLGRHLKSRHTVEIYSNSSDLKTKEKDVLLHRKKGRPRVKEYVESFQCDYCPYRAKSKCALNRHIKGQHNSVQLYPCEHCPYVTKQKDNLRGHVLVKHTDPDKIQWLECEYCPYKTKTKPHLKLHVDFEHFNRAKVKCDHCQYETRFRRRLQIHVLMKHTEEANAVL